jgi:hypothetical protein
LRVYTEERIFRKICRAYDTERGTKSTGYRVGYIYVEQRTHGTRYRAGKT